MGEKIIDKLIEFIKENYTIESDLYEHFNVKRGLRNSDGTGVLVGLTSIGEVRGYIIDENEKVPVDGKLYYRGINVEEIVRSCISQNRFGFEETIFLLLFGVLPTESQLKDFTELLGRMRSLPDGFTEDMILKAPSHNIMNKLARSVLACYSYDSNPDDLSIANVLRQSIKLIARFPTMIAYAFQAKSHYYDKNSLFIHKPQSNLSTAENFLYLTRADNQYTSLEAQLLDMALILHAEHGGGNNSAFATHVVSSTGTDTYSAISAAVGSLKGPKHGGANAKVMGMMDDIMLHVKNWEDEGEVADYLAKIMKGDAYDGAGLIYGMGHAVYTVSDPRAILLKERAELLAEEKGMMDEFNLYRLIERLSPEVFNKFKGGKVISANVDFYSGFVYKMLNIPPELYTPIFAMSRIVGWCAHRIEEIYANGRIIRPAYKSICIRRKYAPLNERKPIKSIKDIQTP